MQWFPKILSPRTLILVIPRRQTNGSYLLFAVQTQIPVKTPYSDVSICEAKTVHIPHLLLHILTCISKRKGGLTDMITELDLDMFFPADKVPEDVDDLVFLWESNILLPSDR